MDLPVNLASMLKQRNAGLARVSTARAFGRFFMFPSITDSFMGLSNQQKTATNVCVNTLNIKLII